MKIPDEILSRNKIKTFLNREHRHLAMIESLRKRNEVLKRDYETLSVRFTALLEENTKLMEIIKEVK